MELQHVKDYAELCHEASQRLLLKVKNSPSLVLGLATGGTPKGIYRLLVEDHRQHGTSYQNVHTVNLDEYVGIPSESPNSYRYYMEHQLFQYIDLPRSQSHIPDGMAVDLVSECQQYDELLAGLGGIDLQILGLGLNGHIGFNEPGTSFHSETHVVELSASTREANRRFFSSWEQVPTQAITMGIASIMHSKEIILLVNGGKKASVLKQLLTGEVNEQLPASILHRHPRVTIIADDEAITGLHSDDSIRI